MEAHLRQPQITRCPSCAWSAPSVICETCPLRPRDAIPSADTHDDAPGPYRRPWRESDDMTPWGAPLKPGT